VKRQLVVGGQTRQIARSKNECLYTRWSVDVSASIKGREYATRHVLTRDAKCIDVDGGVFENVLY
jgi:hypothetical protein